MLWAIARSLEEAENSVCHSILRGGLLDVYLDTSS
jgi:hypothetical protein